MAKKNAQNLARRYYIEFGKSQKEIAALVSVREATVSDWANKGNWDILRNAIIASEKARIQNIRNIISDLAEERLSYSKRIKEGENPADLRKLMASTDDAVSKWNKTLSQLDKSNKIPLDVYLTVMDNVFSALRTYNPKIARELIDFQKMHVHSVAQQH